MNHIWMVALNNKDVLPVHERKQDHLYEYVYVPSSLTEKIY